MIVPAVGQRSLRLVHLVNSVSLCPTFQKMVGADNQDDALPSIYIDLALDDATEPFPRCVVRHNGSQLDQRSGTSTFLGDGEMAIFIQYEMLTPDELLTWYGVTGTVSQADHRMHMNNLFGAIADELDELSNTAGCLEFQSLEQHSCGMIDPVVENGNELIELTYVVHRTGMP